MQHQYQQQVYTSTNLRRSRSGGLCRIGGSLDCAGSPVGDVSEGEEPGVVQGGWQGIRCVLCCMNNLVEASVHRDTARADGQPRTSGPNRCVDGGVCSVAHIIV